MKKLARRQTEDHQQMNNSGKDKKSTVNIKNSKKPREDEILRK